MSYEYFASSLPALKFGDPPPFGPAELLAAASGVLSGPDFAALDALLSGAESEHPFAVAWRDCETQLRNAVARRRAARRGKKKADDGDQNRESPVAGHKAVCQQRHAPFSLGIHDAAADNAGGVAAEAHAHRQRLFAAGAAALKAAVKKESDARQIAHVLEDRKKREEDGHRREHDRNHPSDAADHAVAEQAGDKCRAGDCGQAMTDAAFQQTESPG